jgi:long-chain acyl-CoA synthetase
VPNFAARIAAAADRFADRPAVEMVRGDRVETTTYRELDDDSARLAGWLIENGIGRGDRAALLADNDAPWIGAYLAVLRIGAVAVPLDTAYKADQVRTVLENSGARMLFTTPKYLETARAAIGALAVPPVLVLISGSAPGTIDAATFGNPLSPAAVVDVTDDAAAVILYTSGTTADPKGVVLTHANLDAERAGAFAIVDVGPDDAILGVLPLFHALAQMANLLLPLSVGARVVFLETISSTSLVQALDRRGITIFACVPQFFYLIHQRVTSEVARKGAAARALVGALIGLNVRLRDRLGWNPGRRIFAKVHRTLGSRMRLLVTGGSKFDPAIGRDLYGLGFTILNAYGLTETSGGATIMRPADGFTTSVGQPFPGVEIRIARDDAAPGAADGEILIRGPIVMREYFNRPDATAETLRDGWLHTGDLGWVDDAGRVFITGRKKEIIVLASGKNLYPEEIEAHYRQSAFIKELCVLGLARPGEPASERLHAVVVPDEQTLRNRGIVNLRELVRFEIETLSVQLPAHKRILGYDISLEPLPRTTTGKIRRHQVEQSVRERAASRRERDVAPLTDADRAWMGDDENAAVLAAIERRLDRTTISPAANLELDLGLDSMERVELLATLEQRFSVRVAPEVRATIFTVTALVEAVRSAPRAADDDPAAAEVLPWASILAAPPDPVVDAMLAEARPGRAIVLFCAIRAARLIARVVPGFHVSGVEHVPATGPCIISPNHQAFLDPFFLAAALPFRRLRQVFFVGAAEYFETPLMRWIARQLNVVPVDPDAHLTTAMRAGAAGLRRGQALILFPEGERSIDGHLKPFRKGAAILSAHLDVPIVPVGLDGLFELWPRGRRFNWRALVPGRSRPVTLRFGEPIRVAPGAYVDGTRALRDRVQTLVAAAPRPANRFSWRTQ